MNKALILPLLFSAGLALFQVLNVLLIFVEGGSPAYVWRTLILFGSAVAAFVFLLKGSAYAVPLLLLANIAWVGWLLWISYENQLTTGMPMTTTLHIELALLCIGLFATFFAFQGTRP